VRERSKKILDKSCFFFLSFVNSVVDHPRQAPEFFVVLQSTKLITKREARPMRNEKLSKLFLAIFSIILLIGVFTLVKTEDAKAGVWKYVCCGPQCRLQQYCVDVGSYNCCA
jgi:hypothetical protein